MGSIFSREGSKDYRSRGGGRGRGRGRGGGEEKKVFYFDFAKDFVFADCGTKDSNKNGNRRSVQEKEKEKKGGTMISISIFIFILAREVIWKVMERERWKRGEIEWKREENGNGKDATSNSSSSSFSSLCDELQILILSKVPLHSLVKLRCVSKTWRSWIYKERSFIGKCPLRTDGFFFPQQNGFKYISLPNNDDNYNDEDEDNSYTIADPAPTCSFPFPTIDDVGGGSLKFEAFHHASNGLLLLSTSGGPTVEVLVHNPLTRQSVLLPMASREFSFGPSYIGYEPCRSPYFNFVHAFSECSSDPLVLHIFSSRSWTWHDLVTDVRRPAYSPRYDGGRAVMIDGQMFIDLTFIYSIVLVVDLRTTGKEDYVIVPLPPGLPPRLKDACSALGMCEGNIMFAYTQAGVLLVYKLLPCIEQGRGDYRWTLLIEDTSLQDRLASKAGMAPTIRVDPHDFLLHVPVLLISSSCSVTWSCKVFSYNLRNGSLLQLCGSKYWIHKVTPLSISPLEIYSGELSSKYEKKHREKKKNMLWQFLS